MAISKWNIIGRAIRKYEYWDNILRTRAQLKKFCDGYHSRLYNWSIPVPPDIWLVEFIENRNLLNGHDDKRIGLYSIFGTTKLMRFDKVDARIFVDRENLHKPQMQGWLHRYLDDERFSLSLGFDELDHPQYMHFPFWLMWSVFSPTADFAEIKREVERMNSPENSSFDRFGFCAYICSHDDIGRRKTYEQFNAIAPISCAGRLFHNDDRLKTEFNDDKLKYLREFRFNLTPENSNFKGYVTEKLFEAISSGCVPIYHGSENNPEPEILNQDAIIFMEVGADNEDAIKLVTELNANRKLYEEFAHQPRLTKESPELIWQYYVDLENRIKEIVKNL